MPELPEVETVVRGLRSHLIGRRIVRVEQRRADLRAPLPRRFAARVMGRFVHGVERRAKYILIRLAAREVPRGRARPLPNGDELLIVHLGMSGRFVLGPRDKGPPGAHDHVEFVLDNGMRLSFSDPRRFGLIDLIGVNRVGQDARLKGLGPEPLSDDFRSEMLEKALARRHGPIKSVLLDQRLVAGLGNIYACEALYRAGISPTRKASTIKGDRARRLVQAIKETLLAAIAAGGSSARDYVQASGELGWFQHHWAVYDREGQPCPGCDCGRVHGVRRIVQAGRSTFYCAKRQR